MPWTFRDARAMLRTPVSALRAHDPSLAGPTIDSDETPGSPHVLIATPRAVPDVGGVEKHVWETTRRLAARGLRITIVATARDNTRQRTETIEGVHIVRVPAHPRRRDYYFAPGLPGAIARIAPDVVHCQSYHTLVPPLAMLGALAARIPYVLSFHSGGDTSQLRTRLRGTHRTALRPLVRRAASLICVSEFERDLLADRFGLPIERFRVIRNGGDLPDPGPVAPGPSRVVASIGRLERYKGHHRVIESLPEMLRRAPDVRLELVGDGPYRDALLGLADGLGVGHAVTVRSLPASDTVGMARLMRSASAVVLLSDYESQGLAAVEAAGVGTPVLVQRRAALTELADAGWADAVPSDASANDIATAILRLVERRPDGDDPPQIPTWDDCATELLSVYLAIARLHPGQ